MPKHNFPILACRLNFKISTANYKTIVSEDTFNVMIESP